MIDPLQVRLGEVQLAPDGRQRHVDDRDVDDRHEERNSEDGEGAPAVDRVVMTGSLSAQLAA